MTFTRLAEPCSAAAPRLVRAGSSGGVCVWRPAGLRLAVGTRINYNHHDKLVRPSVKSPSGRARRRTAAFGGLALARGSAMLDWT
jgi:hypothetical protein